MRIGGNGCDVASICVVLGSFGAVEDGVKLLDRLPTLLALPGDEDGNFL